MSRDDARIAECRAKLAADPNDGKARLELAMHLVMSNRDHDATPEVVWAWQHGDPAVMRKLEPAIQRLVQRHLPARAAFTDLRDRALPSSAPTAAEWSNWARLNWLLDADERVVTWYDTTYPTLANRDAIAPTVERMMVRLLVERGRWAEAGRLIADPLARIAQLLPRRSGPVPVVPPELAARAELIGQRGRCFFASVHVRALLAAERADDARAVADYCRSVDDSPAMDQALTALGVPAAS